MWVIDGNGRHSQYRSPACSCRTQRAARNRHFVTLQGGVQPRFQDTNPCVTCVFVVGTAALTGGRPSTSSSEQSSTSSGDSASLTVALGVGLAVAVTIIVLVVVVTVVRRVIISRQKTTVDLQYSAAAAATSRGGPARVWPSWGFDSIRSKYSVYSDDSTQSS